LALSADYNPAAATAYVNTFQKRIKQLTRLRGARQQLAEVRGL
jgi:hypothetical protein